MSLIYRKPKITFDKEISIIAMEKDKFFQEVRAIENICRDAGLHNVATILNEFYEANQ